MAKISYKDKAMSSLSLKESIEKVNLKFNTKRFFNIIICLSASMFILFIAVLGIANATAVGDKLEDLRKSLEKDNFIKQLLAMFFVTLSISSMVEPAAHLSEKHQAKKKLKICRKLFESKNLKITRSELRLAGTVTLESDPLDIDQITTNYIFIPNNENVVVAKEVGRNGQFGFPTILPESDAIAIIGQHPVEVAEAVGRMKALKKVEEEFFGDIKRR